MTDNTVIRWIAVVLAVMAIGGVAVSGVALAQESAGSDEVDAQHTSYLRLVHAAADAPAVDVAIDNETIASNVEYETVSTYLELEAGNHTITVTAANETNGTTAEPVFEGTIYLEQRTVSTLALAGAATSTGEMDETTNATVTDTPTDGTATATPTDGMDETPTDGMTDTPVDGAATDGMTETPADGAATDGMTETPADGAATDGMTETPTDGATTDNETADAPEMDGAPALTPVLLMDNAWEPDSGNATVSVVHLAPGAGAVDVTVGGEDDGMDGNASDNASMADNVTANESMDGNESENVTVLADDVEFGSGSNYVTVPAGDYTLDIREATETNDGDVLMSVNVSVEGGTAYSALAMAPQESTNETDNATDNATDDPLNVQLTEDATFTVNLPETGENLTVDAADATADDNVTAAADDATTEDDDTTAENDTAMADGEDNVTTDGEDNVTTDGEDNVTTEATSTP